MIYRREHREKLQKHRLIDTQQRCNEYRETFEKGGFAWKKIP